ncbi:hypothetical protein QJS10_CPA09g00280 [Acorus calamus]|uniref:Uncharacterized protein n=1 Tax=Acorus calamus TaxID=4465 RepID=A0AAV9E412_ACOCL|nr:hypothetical protein QJS10_CPA09g00280 [Acorus calamus]
MSGKKIMYTCILLLVLILSVEVLPSEGRELKHKVQVECAKCAVAQEKNSESEPSIDKQDFRPTAPGHSPGIGHSLKNKGVDKNV